EQGGSDRPGAAGRTSGTRRGGGAECRGVAGEPLRPGARGSPAAPASGRRPGAAPPGDDPQPLTGPPGPHDTAPGAIMDIKLVQADCTEHATPLLAVKIFEDEDGLVGPVARVDERMGGQISGVIRRGDFEGKEGQTLVLYPASGALPAERVLLVGLGKRASLDLERLRRAAGTAAKQALRLRVPRFSSIMHHAELVSDRISARAAARAVAEGAVLGAYAFDELKSAGEGGEGAGKTVLEEMEILEKVAEKAEEMRPGVRVGSIVARGELLARDLGNRPGN